MNRRGIWLSAAARDGGDVPLVWLHHEPFPAGRVNDDHGWYVLSDDDPWFDALLTVLVNTRDRFLTLVIGLLMVGHWELASVPLIPRTIRPRPVARPVLRDLVPAYLRSAVHSTAPPTRPRGVGQPVLIT